MAFGKFGVDESAEGFLLYSTSIDGALMACFRLQECAQSPRDWEGKAFTVSAAATLLLGACSECDESGGRELWCLDRAAIAADRRGTGVKWAGLQGDRHFESAHEFGGYLACRLTQAIGQWIPSDQWGGTRADGLLIPKRVPLSDVFAEANVERGLGDLLALVRHDGADSAVYRRVRTWVLAERDDVLDHPDFAGQLAQPATTVTAQLSAGAITHVEEDPEPLAEGDADTAPGEIPAEFRSRSMRYVEAGKLLGWTGTPESIGRRFNRNKKHYPRIKRSKDEFVFDVRAFPASVQQGMLPRA